MVPVVVADSDAPLPITIEPEIESLLIRLMFPSFADRLDPGAILSGPPAVVTEIEPLVDVVLPMVRPPAVVEILKSAPLPVVVPAIEATFTVAVPVPALKLTTLAADNEPPDPVTLMDPAEPGLKSKFDPRPFAARADPAGSTTFTEPSVLLL